MSRCLLLGVALLVMSPAMALERPEVTYKIFQFPPNMIPRIDGNADDWAMVPDDYAIGIDQLVDRYPGSSRRPIRPTWMSRLRSVGSRV